MTAKKIKFIHLRPHYLSEDAKFPDAHGGATIAYSLEGNTVKYGIAKCYYKDRYNKKIGRQISAHRLSSIVRNFTLPDVKDNSAIVKALVEVYYCEEEALHGDDTVRIYVK